MTPRSTIVNTFAERERGAARAPSGRGGVRADVATAMPY